MRPALCPQRGVSLIEALVAMTIMGFGMLGVLGMQATLRGNGDIAKQRSEAVRIAQAQMETSRAFSVLDSTGGGARAYADIASIGAVSVVQDNINTDFQLIRTVTSFPANDSQDYLAARKTLTIDVNWKDRNNVTQTVQLSSVITASAPEISAALTASATGSALQSPAGRHVAIPRGAVSVSGGNSEFTPPNAPSGLKWVFSNTTGFIRQTCLGGVCTDFTGRLLAGYVRFSTALAQPTAAESRAPTSARISGTRVEVNITAPAQSAPAVPLACYLDESDASYVAYYCAVPIGASPNQFWSGTSVVQGLPIAPDVNSVAATAYRICRYTAVRSQADPPAVANLDHPYLYKEVKESLVDQNFLVIAAGNGSVAFSCPNDTELTGRTMEHQPRLP